jgi:hypothetical protein
MSKTSADAIAAFLAKGGKVSKVAAGASNGMTARDWHKAARDDDRTVNRLIEQRIEVAGGVVNGLGEAIYRD